MEEEEDEEVEQEMSRNSEAWAGSHSPAIIIIPPHSMTTDNSHVHQMPLLKLSKNLRSIVTDIADLL